VAQDPALAEAVADAVLAHPAVVRLSGGAFGTVASYLPGRRVVGVRLPLADSDPVEVAVVARLGAVLPLLAVELGDAVAAVVGPVAVDVTVTDVEAGAGAEASSAPVHPARPVTGGLA
jgi:hypothetical protein